MTCKLERLPAEGAHLLDGCMWLIRSNDIQAVEAYQMTFKLLRLPNESTNLFDGFAWLIGSTDSQVAEAAS